MANFKKYTKKNGQEAWQFSAYLGTDPKTGKRIKTTRRGFETKKQAQRACSQLLAEFDADTWASQENDSIDSLTFKELIELWLETVYKDSVVESTYIVTENIINNHVLPHFGNAIVAELTPLKCQQLALKMHHKRALSIVKRVLRYAVVMEIISVNPAEYVTVKSVEKPTKIRRLSQENVDTLLEHLNNLPDIYHIERTKVLIYLLMSNGLRISEALALTWSDIHFNDSTITIDKTFSKVKGGTKISKPKTLASDAILPASDFILNALKRFRVYQKKKRLAAGLNVKEELIFSQLDGSKISYEIASRQVRTIFNECGIDYHGTHTFRHTFASILLDEGEDLKVVQEVMRHSDISLTANLYGKLALKTKRRAVDEMAVKMAVKGLR